MTEEQFFERINNGWGDREVYSIQNEEIQLLLSFGAKLLPKKNNGDGTFSTTLTLRGKTFICISVEATNATPSS